MAKRTRKQEMRLQQANKERRRKQLLIGVPLFIVVAVLGFVIINRFLIPIEGIETFMGLSREHNVNAEFNTNGLPPAGGEHKPQWLNCGIYSEPVDTAYAVHSLEHGAIWITHKPQIDPTELQKIYDIGRDDSLILISPYEGQTYDIVVTAWQAQMVPDNADDTRIPQFIARYRGGGPEPGTNCSNGVGVPDA